MKTKHQTREQMLMLVSDEYLKRIQNLRHIFRQTLQFSVFVAIKTDLNGRNTLSGWHWERYREMH